MNQHLPTQMSTVTSTDCIYLCGLCTSSYTTVNSFECFHKIGIPPKKWMVYNGKTFFFNGWFWGEFPPLFSETSIFPPTPPGWNIYTGGGGKFRDSPLRPPSPYLGRGKGGANGGGIPGICKWKSYIYENQSSNLLEFCKGCIYIYIIF